MLELFLLAIALLIYIPCLNGPPIYDDAQLFMNQDWSRAAMMKPKFRWIPMATMGLTFNYVPPKYQIQVFHLTSAVIHWINALLVQGLAGYFLDPVGSAVAMIVFLIHPLTVPAVAPLATRSTVMATTFILLSMIAMVSGYFPLAPLFMTLAILCREDAVSVALLSIALGFMDSMTTGFIMVGIAGLAAVIVPIRQCWAWLQERNGDWGILQVGLVASFEQPKYSLAAIAENTTRWPWWVIGVKMSPDPLIPEHSFKSLRFWCAIGIMILAIVLIGTGPPILQVSLLLIGFSPWVATWFIPLPDSVAESRAYATVPAIALMVGLLPWTLSLILCLWWICLAIRRSYIQRHPVPYWLFTWDETQPKFRVALNIGAAYQSINDLDNARIWHMKALELQPENGIALANLGLWHEGMSRVERHMLAQSYIQTGRIDAKEADQRNQQSLAHLAHALQLMEQAIHSCPQDPCVQQYTKMVRDAADRVGLKMSVA